MAPSLARAQAERMLRGGLPSAASSAIMLLIPIVGRFYLPEARYAVWALLATVLSASLLFDFGAPLVATRQAVEANATRRILSQVFGLSALGSVLIGGACLAAWPVLASHGRVASNTIQEYALLVGMVFGSTLRSGVVVYAAVALGRGKFGIRSRMLLGAAAAQAALTVGGLNFGLQLWSLPMGLIASNAGAIVYAMIRLRPDPGGQVRSGVGLARFGATRAVAVIVGLVITQFDRWVLALIASPAFLGEYDVALRVAVIPKLVILAMCASVPAEAASLVRDRDWANLRRTVRRLTIWAVALGSIAGAGVIALGIFVQVAGLLESGGVFLVVLVMMTVAHTVSGMTAPQSMAISGAGAPELELPYLTSCGLFVVLGYGLSLATHLPGVAVGGIAVGLVLSSTWFLMQLTRYLHVIEVREEFA